MQCEFPRVNEPNEAIKEIFESVKVIAVPGLSPDESKPSHRVAKYLKEVGYKIVPIYPKEDEILGEKVYRSIEEVPFEIDMIDMFRKPEVASQMLEVMQKRGDIKVLWLQEGIVNNDVGEKAKELGYKFVQNKCTMVEHRGLFG